MGDWGFRGPRTSPLAPRGTFLFNPVSIDCSYFFLPCVKAHLRTFQGGTHSGTPSWVRSTITGRHTRVWGTMTCQGHTHESGALSQFRGISSGQGNHHRPGALPRVRATMTGQEHARVRGTCRSGLRDTLRRVICTITGQGHTLRPRTYSRVRATLSGYRHTHRSGQRS